ncbi:MAG TPA: hypothetical protein VNI77_07905 [Nitrososphaera sp.]|nr:hypothetical protein [Nitrososphaera sp.]
MEELRVALAPRGSLLREYIKTAFYYVNNPEEIQSTPYGLVVKGHDLRESLSDSVRLARRTIEKSASRHKSVNKKIVEFPFDGNARRYQTLEKINRFLSLKKDSSVSELFEGYANYLTSKCTLAELQTCMQIFDNGYPNDSKKTVKLAALSVFKPEQYEFGRSYGYIGNRDQGLYLGVHSTILGMVGFVLSKVGVVSVGTEYLTVLITPEDISKDVEVLTLRKYLDGIESIRRVSIPGLNPVEALILWLGLRWSSQDAKLINVIIIKEPKGQTPSSLYHEYAFNLKTVMWIADIIRNARYNLEKYYELLLKEALTADAKEREFAVRIVKKIFQVINGSEKPEELTYAASRDALVAAKYSQGSNIIRRVAPDIALEIYGSIKLTNEL